MHEPLAAGAPAQAPASGPAKTRLQDIGFDDAGLLALPQLLDIRAGETPDAPAIVAVRRSLTFAEWSRAGSRLAHRIRELLGELSGERVLVWLGNDEADDFVCALHAILKNAGVVVALDDRSTVDEVRSLIDETDPSGMIIGPAVVARLGKERLRELGAELGEDDRDDVIHVVPIEQRQVGTAVGAWHISDPGEELSSSVARPEDAAFIFFSSGSTGRPKGAVWTHSDLSLYAERAAHAIYALPRGGRPLTPDDVLQSPIPLYTAASLMENVYSTVIAGCTLVYENSRFDAARSERRMHELRTTIYNGAPPHFAMMCDLPAGDQPPCLDLLISGGSAFTKALHRRMAERWPGAAIANWYGLMESGTGQTLSWGEDIAREPESIGRPVWPTEVRVVDADRNDVDDGVEGELWLRAPAQMREYFRNPEQTAQRLHAGWLRTGDRARKDGSGLYHVVGRTEDRINRGGFKFYPAELESVLEQHEGVREAGVIAVPHPTLGEDVVAFVVIGAGGEVSEEDLKQHCRQRVAANKVPAQILFEETLPRSSYGKVVRRELAERYASRKEDDE